MMMSPLIVLSFWLLLTAFQQPAAGLSVTETKAVNKTVIDAVNVTEAKCEIVNWRYKYFADPWYDDPYSTINSLIVILFSWKYSPDYCTLDQPASFLFTDYDDGGSGWPHDTILDCDTRFSYNESLTENITTATVNNYKLGYTSRRRNDAYPVKLDCSYHVQIISNGHTLLDNILNESDVNLEKSSDRKLVEFNLVEYNLTYSRSSANYTLWFSVFLLGSPAITIMQIRVVDSRNSQKYFNRDGIQIQDHDRVPSENATGYSEYTLEFKPLAEPPHLAFLRLLRKGPNGRIELYYKQKPFREELGLAPPFPPTDVRNLSIFAVPDEAAADEPLRMSHPRQFTVNITWEPPEYHNGRPGMTRYEVLVNASAGFTLYSYNLYKGNSLLLHLVDERNNCNLTVEVRARNEYRLSSNRSDESSHNLGPSCIPATENPTTQLAWIAALPVAPVATVLIFLIAFWCGRAIMFQINRIRHPVIYKGCQVRTVNSHVDESTFKEEMGKVLTIDYKRFIGHGNFGCVFYGELRPKSSTEPAFTTSNAARVDLFPDIVTMFDNSWSNKSDECCSYVSPEATARSSLKLDKELSGFITETSFSATGVTSSTKRWLTDAGACGFDASLHLEGMTDESLQKDFSNETDFSGSSLGRRATFSQRQRVSCSPLSEMVTLSGTIIPIVKPKASPDEEQRLDSGSIQSVQTTPPRGKVNDGEAPRVLNDEVDIRLICLPLCCSLEIEEEENGKGGEEEGNTGVVDAEGKKEDKAVAEGEKDDESTQPVAVKIIRAICGQSHNERDIARLKIMNEIEVLKKLGESQRVVQLICSLQERIDIVLVLEYHQYGDLLRNLQTTRARRLRKGQEVWPMDVKVEEQDYCMPSLDIKEGKMFTIAREIAEGMRFIADKGFVHCDLGARNILMTKDATAKISDFGLAFEVSSAAEQDDRPLALRWSPPEVVKNGTYTTKSDVWSYGIVLWEMWTYGATPYHQFPDNKEVAALIGEKAGHPTMCPTWPRYVRQLMTTCWVADPDDRPTFMQIEEFL